MKCKENNYKTEETQMKNTINAKVICRKNSSGTLNFYLEAKGQEIYLFVTKYYSYNMYSMYRNGVRAEKAFEHTENFRHQKLKERIIRMVKYVSDENDLDIFKDPDHRRRRHTFFTSSCELHTNLLYDKQDVELTLADSL